MRKSIVYGWICALAWYYRKRNGKLVSERADEYRGIAPVSRPEGVLIWLHGVSVGESLSTLPLIAILQQHYPESTILLTSSTKSSAEVLCKRLPSGVIHQFLPLDHPLWVRRFYEHWQPTLGVWFESELWPNLCLEADCRDIPRVLLNGRMSRKSFDRWSLLPRLSRAMTTGFAAIRVQDQENYNYFHGFGATHARIGANSKDAAEKLPCDQMLFAQWQDILRYRRFWLASSTHPGEEEIVLAAHQIVRREFPDALCLVVPRHVERGQEIFTKTHQKADFLIQLDSDSVQHSADCGLYIFDILGQLGTLYRLSDLAFIGGSLVPKGGHNMREALLLRCLPIIGPHMENFSKHKTYFSGYYDEITDAESLAEAVSVYLRNPNQMQARAQSAQKLAESQSEGFVDEMLEILDSILVSP